MRAAARTAAEAPGDERAAGAAESAASVRSSASRAASAPERRSLTTASDVDSTRAEGAVRSRTSGGTPFGVVNDAAGRVRVVLDRDLLARPALKSQALVNTMTTVIPPEGLLRFLEEQGYPPLLVDLGIHGV